MANIVLVLLTCVVAVLDIVQAHSWCGHAQARQKHEEYRAQEAPGARWRMKADALARRAKASKHERQLADAQSSQPLRVVYDYQLLQSTPPDLADYIQGVLMPAAAAVLRRVLRVCYLNDPSWAPSDGQQMKRSVHCHAHNQPSYSEALAPRQHPQDEQWNVGQVLDSVCATGTTVSPGLVQLVEVHQL